MSVDVGADSIAVPSRPSTMSRIAVSFSRVDSATLSASIRPWLVSLRASSISQRSER